VTNTPPQTLAELLARASGIDPNDIHSDTSYGNFDYDTSADYKDRPDIADSAITNEHNVGIQFINGDYDVKDKKAILAGAEAYGREVLLAAEMFGVNIADLAEFKDADYNGDGQIDAREIGLTILAATLKTDHQEGEAAIVSTFTNDITARAFEALLDPRSAHVATEIAKQLLGDNDEHKATNTDEANEEFINAIKDKLA
jgi:hypothetical protein